MIDNDFSDLFEALNLKVSTVDGVLVEESAKAKEFRTRDERTGSTSSRTIEKEKSEEITIPLSEYFNLPAHEGYIVSGNSNDLVWIGKKATPISFKATKVADK